MEEQVQEGVRGDRDHGEPQPSSAGERPARSRRRTLSGPQLEERGDVLHSFCVSSQLTLLTDCFTVIF